MNQAHPQPDGTEPEAPPALAAGLSSLYGGRVNVPAEIDAAVLDHSRRELRARHTNRRPWTTWGPLAAAAALALTTGVYLAFLPVRGRVQGPVATSASAARDLDGDGTVDIVDAMVLAGAIEHPGVGAPARDINGDGVIDSADVNSLALFAVRIDGSGGGT